jgi:hypothetical protein
MRKGEDWIRKMEVVALVAIALLVLIGYVISRIRGS